MYIDYNIYKNVLIALLMVSEEEGEARGCAVEKDDDGGGEMSARDRFYKGVDRPRRPRASVAAGALFSIYGEASRRVQPW